MIVKLKLNLKLLHLILTCSPLARPCQRCIKRNLATSCTDGARKKAKYLQDIEGMQFWNCQKTLILSPVNVDAASNGGGIPYSPQPSLSTPTMNTFVTEATSFQPQNFLDTGKSSYNAGNNGRSDKL